MAQGIVSHVNGDVKTETANQRKYYFVTPLGDQNRRLQIKSGKYLYQAVDSEINYFQGDGNGHFILRGGKSDAFLAESSYRAVMLDLISGNYITTDQMIPTVECLPGVDPAQFEIYRKTDSDVFTVEYYNVEGELQSSAEKPQEPLLLSQGDDESVDGTDYIFVGWTADPEKSQYLPLESSANLFDFEDLSKTASIKPAVKEEHSLLGYCDPEGANYISYDEAESLLSADGVLRLYPVYAVKGFAQAVTADEGGTMIVGVSDFKDDQMGAGGTAGNNERWLGSIDIEVYRDGEMWVPLSDDTGSGSSIGRRKLMARRDPDVRATMYFPYHNDDAADLNIKFIEDGTTTDTLYEYMSSSTFDAKEPTEQYIIDAVMAEQGGSEDGLKFKYNWLDPEYGGQLDNVKGGSVVKIYVTTRYQVKYYLDSGDGNGYQELTSEKYLDENYYTTAGTEQAVENIKSGSDYYVTPDDDDLGNLIKKTQNLSDGFVDTGMIRGEYSTFLYKFNEYPHLIDPLPELPDESEIPEGTELDRDEWVIRVPKLTDSDSAEGTRAWAHEVRALSSDEFAALSLKEAGTAAPGGSIEVTDTVYGTGTTAMTFRQDYYDDNTNTYHLYARVLAGVTVEKTVIGGEAEADQEFSFTLT
ncbi:MAG: hypothetical protein II173_04885, partial [Firmicutes bacterium]|nr:hypothetical protein [Bacillota bacterium]